MIVSIIFNHLIAKLRLQYPETTLAVRALKLLMTLKRKRLIPELENRIQNHSIDFKE